jgi:hypothetical protein
MISLGDRVSPLRSTRQAARSRYRGMTRGARPLFSALLSSRTPLAYEKRSFSFSAVESPF